MLPRRRARRAGGRAVAGRIRYIRIFVIPIHNSGSVLDILYTTTPLLVRGSDRHAENWRAGRAGWRRALVGVRRPDGVSRNEGHGASLALVVVLVFGARYGHDWGGDEQLGGKLCDHSGIGG